MRKVFKTLVHQALLATDTIEYEGKLWLVPEWLAGPIQGTERPARIIGLHGLVTEKAHPPYDKDVDMILLIPLSKDTLAGGTAQGLVVIQAPNIVLSLKDDTQAH